MLNVQRNRFFTRPRWKFSESLSPDVNVIHDLILWGQIQGHNLESSELKQQHLAVVEQSAADDKSSGADRMSQKGANAEQVDI